MPPAGQLPLIVTYEVVGGVTGLSGVVLGQAEAEYTVVVR